MLKVIAAEKENYLFFSICFSSRLCYRTRRCCCCCSRSWGSRSAHRCSPPSRHTAPSARPERPSAHGRNKHRHPLRRNLSQVLKSSGFPYLPSTTCGATAGALPPASPSKTRSSRPACSAPAVALRTQLPLGANAQPLYNKPGPFWNLRTERQSGWVMLSVLPGPSEPELAGVSAGSVQLPRLRSPPNAPRVPPCPHLKPDRPLVLTHTLTSMGN